MLMMQFLPKTTLVIKKVPKYRKKCNSNCDVNSYLISKQSLEKILINLKNTQVKITARGGINGISPSLNLFTYKYIKLLLKVQDKKKKITSSNSYYCKKMQ